MGQHSQLPQPASADAAADTHGRRFRGQHRRLTGWALLMLGVGIGVASVAILLWPETPPTWWHDEAILDADFENSRFRFGQIELHSLEALLTAAGGTATGAAITFQPKVVGTELLRNPDFAAGIADWTASSGYEPATSLSWTGSALQNAATGQSRVSSPVALAPGKAYRVSAERVSGGSSSFSIATGAAFGSAWVTTAFTTGTANVSYHSAHGPAHVGFIDGNAGTRVYDNFSVREVVPLSGWNFRALGGMVVARTGASLPSVEQVLMATDQGRESTNRFMKLVWGTDGHVRLIVAATAEVANLDLGPVAADTGFELRFSLATDAFSASLDGAAVVSDKSGVYLSGAFLHIGKALLGGGVWSGAISRVSLFPRALADNEIIDPDRAFVIHGDSTAFGTGAGGDEFRWYRLMADSYAPPRAVISFGVGGSATGPLVERIVEHRAYGQRTTILMDRPNTGEPPETWLANVKAAIALLDHDRWIVVPPVENSPGGLPDASSATIIAVQAALLHDGFFAGHSFTSAELAAYSAALASDATRRPASKDFIHFGPSGQIVQADAVRTLLDRLGL